MNLSGRNPNGDVFGIGGCWFRTTGEQADVEQRLAQQLGRLPAQHVLRPADPHPFLLEPADQPKQLTVTIKGVTAQVAAGEEDTEEVDQSWRNVITHTHTQVNILH